MNILRVPEHARRGIDNYAQDHVPPGGFIRAVMENNLFEAFGRADEENFAAMGEIVRYIYNHTPSNCHGSPERVRAWLESGAAMRAMENSDEPARD